MSRPTASPLTPTSHAFLPLQQARLAAAPPTGPGWVQEVKLDGYRMQLRVETGRQCWWSRNGHDWSARLADFAPLAASLPDGVYDGELCLLGDDGQPDFSALRSAMGRRQVGAMEGGLVFFAFDLLVAGGGDLRSLPLEERRARLAAALPEETGDHPTIRRVTPLPGGGQDLLKAACAMGLEGIVSKRLDSVYQGGPKRADTWLKAKCRPAQEVVIGGWTAEGPRLRSLMAGVWESGALRYVGNVGAGFSAATSADVLPRLRRMEAPSSPFGPGGPAGRAAGVHWAHPEIVAEVEIAEWTGAGKLRQASFKRLRDPADKRSDQVRADDQSPPGE